MSSSREGSPDWLREFQAPSKSFVDLSSESDSSPEGSPARSNPSYHKEPVKHQKRQDSILTVCGEDIPVVKAKKPKTIKSETTEGRREDTLDAYDEGPVEEDIQEKPAAPQVSARLPLVLPDKVQRSKALVECDGDSVDLSGDVGAVGRVVISNGLAGTDEMLLDLKGTIYKSKIVPSRTFCVVSVGQSEAKIEAIMNDFIQLEPQSNLFEAETMVEGTLDGFSFDSEEEADKMPKSSAHQRDENNENGDQSGTNSKQKLEKSLGKKGKNSAKTHKKGVRKPPIVKKPKKSKK